MDFRRICMWMKPDALVPLLTGFDVWFGVDGVSAAV